MPDERLIMKPPMRPPLLPHKKPNCGCAICISIRYINWLEFRLAAIANTIEVVDNRCMAVDGPVTPTLQEMTQAEISEIYQLAKGN